MWWIVGTYAFIFGMLLFWRLLLGSTKGGEELQVDDPRHDDIGPF